MTDPDWIAFGEPLIKGLKIYHRYAALGLENIPRKQGAIIVVNHSLATYDILMLMHSIFEQTGRLPRPLVDRLVTKAPILGAITSRVGCLSASPLHAHHLLEQNQLVVVAPGGMAEAIRPHTERYRTLWKERKGFIRLSINTGAPVILAFCPDSDDLFKVYDAHLTQWMYRSLRLPFMLARGLGPTPLPRPIKLKHYISAPLIPPPPPHTPTQEQSAVEDFHSEVSHQANELMNRATRLQKRRRGHQKNHQSGPSPTTSSPSSS